MSSQTNLFFEDKNLGLEQPDVNIETDTPSKQLFTKKNNDLYIKSYENSDDDFKYMTKNNREINTSNLYYPRSILNGNYIRCYNPLVAKDWCKPCQTDILSGNSEVDELIQIMRFETIVNFYLITKLTCYVLESRDPQTIIRNSQERYERLAKANPNSYMMVIMWSNDGDLFNYIKKTSNDEKFTWHKRLKY
uniref:Uncharacterized protein n=1 Tax=Rhizophagus irregularis (strain DAOM 181602 / DAOM 197198 / MUCL 43194) TaxID=747089 RepID=U9SWU4_RHIID